MKRKAIKRYKEKDDEDTPAEAMMALATNAKRKAEEERHQPSFPMPYIDPLSLMLESEMRRQAAKANDGKFAMRQTFIGQETSHSRLPLASLSKISLQEMQVRRRHEGKYLLCRIITPPARMVGVTFSVEDPKGWSQVMAVYNYPGTQSANERELETLFPVNSVVAIREPWAKMALAGSQTLIRVDSPSDIIFFREGDELLTNIQWSSGPRPLPALSRPGTEWKSVGDRHFQEKEYFASSVAYKRALERQPSLTAARLNLSLALIRLQSYDAALDELRRILSLVDLPAKDRQKALYRSGQAHHGEGRYTEALEAYQECLSLDETLQEVQSGIQQCEMRIKEKETGTFDWSALFHETITHRKEVDVADFIGPIKIARLEHRGGGRGIVATRGIAAGELLLVTKPFAVSNQQSARTEAVLAFNFLTNKIDGSSHLEVIQKSVHKLCMGSDDTARDFYTLYAGDKEPYSDVLLHTEETRNIFARDIDYARVEAVCSLNWFGLDGEHAADTNILAENQTNFDRGCALYILPSYFNHACLSNATRAFLGSIMAIRATRDIPNGAEITLAYCPNEYSYYQRKNFLPKWFPECDCALCNQDRAAGSNKLSTRESLIKKLNTSELDTNGLVSLIQKVDATYAASHGSFRPDLSRAHQRVASQFESTYQYNHNTRLLKSSIKHYILALKAWEIDVIDESVEGKNTYKEPLPIAKTVVPANFHMCTSLCLVLFRAFSSLRDKARAGRWLRAAIWIESAATGCNRHTELLKTFDEQASSLLRKIEPGL